MNNYNIIKGVETDKYIIYLTESPKGEYAVVYGPTVARSIKTNDIVDLGTALRLFDMKLKEVGLN